MICPLCPVETSIAALLLAIVYPFLPERHKCKVRRVLRHARHRVTVLLHRITGNRRATP
jgi:hypothetical protein